MNYYISARTGRRKKAGKTVFVILAYVLVFALSFFVSFKLVAGTQSNSQEIEAMTQEIADLNAQLATKDEYIASLEMQIENINRSIAEKEAAEAAAAEAAALAEAEGTEESSEE